MMSDVFQVDGKKELLQALLKRDKSVFFLKSIGRCWSKDEWIWSWLQDVLDLIELITLFSSNIVKFWSRYWDSGKSKWGVRLI
jgi:6-phosphogluconate dehydrogenase (decarboxylating)